jgi:hypothetical protein
MEFAQNESPAQLYRQEGTPLAFGSAVKIDDPDAGKL